MCRQTAHQARQEGSQERRARRGEGSRLAHHGEPASARAPTARSIPRKILNKFTCTVNGKEVFSADFEPAISANPYIQFKFKATESGPVVLTWIDDDGSTIVGEDSIKVL